MVIVGDETITINSGEADRVAVIKMLPNCQNRAVPNALSMHAHLFTDVDEDNAFCNCVENLILIMPGG